jgi:hypothetical protein
VSESGRQIIRPRWWRTIFPWSLAGIAVLWIGTFSSARGALPTLLLILITSSWVLPFTEWVVVDERGVSSRRWWTKRTHTSWDEIEQIRGARFLESVHLVLDGGRRKPLFSHRADADDVVERLRRAGHGFGWVGSGAVRSPDVSLDPNWANPER